MPVIIAFLGYNPLPEAATLGERLVRQRTTLGMSQKNAAIEMGVDPATLARWERGEREPTGALLGSVTRFLDESVGKPTRVRTATSLATSVVAGDESRAYLRTGLMNAPLP